MPIPKLLPRRLFPEILAFAAIAGMVAGAVGYVVGDSLKSEEAAPTSAPAAAVVVAPAPAPAPATPIAESLPAAAPPDRNTATCITTQMQVPEATWDWAVQQADATDTATQDVIARRLQTMDLDAQAEDYARAHLAGRIAVPCWLVDEVERRLQSEGQVVTPVSVTAWLEAGLVASVQATPPPAAPNGALSKETVTAILTEAGWPDARIDDALCITWHESKWIPTVHNTHDPGLGSYGLFQIEAWWASDAVADDFGPTFDLARAFDPLYNARFALRIYEREGWRVWGTAHLCRGLVLAFPAPLARAA